MEDIFLNQYLNSIKETIKSHKNIYIFFKTLKNFFGATSYIFQRFKLQSQNNQLMLGFSGKLSSWVTFDIIPGADYLGSIKDLSLFSSNSMNRIYASHVLEHINSKDAEIALQEMYRVLKPKGELFIVVPDLLVLSQFLETEFSQTAIDIMYGVNRPLNDWNPQHQYGYTKTSLRELLLKTKFTEIEEFEPFINDTSRFRLQDTPISLCLKARKLEPHL